MSMRNGIRIGDGGKAMTLLRLDRSSHETNHSCTGGSMPMKEKLTSEY